MSQPATEWTLLSLAGIKPTPRAGSSLVHMDGALYTFGGQCYSGAVCKIHIECLQALKMSFQDISAIYGSLTSAIRPGLPLKLTVPVHGVDTGIAWWPSRAACTYSAATATLVTTASLIVQSFK